MAGGAPIPIPVKDDEVMLSIDDIARAGSSKMTTMVREFYNSGSTFQTTIAENSSAFSRYRLRSRVLVDISGLDTSSVCLDRKIKFPLCVAPAGIQGMAHSEGELATARACATVGVNMAISTFSSYPTDEVVAASDGNVNFAMQLYTMKDRALQARMIKRAEQAGCKAIFLTADSAVLGVRFNEHRSDFRTPAELSFPNLEMTSEMIRDGTHDSKFTAFNDGSHNWERDIPWLRSKTKMQIWIKGVMTAEDAELAVKYGCDGIIVSNHGGRQLDGVPATIDALVECVEAVQGEIPVHVDGGFRKGTDIFIALALGADCVWVGRPVLWGLAYNGQTGVERALEILYEDFRRCMALCGCRNVKEITKASLARLTADGVLKRVE